MIRFDIPYVEADRTLTQAGYEVFSGQERRIGAAEADIAVLEAADATEAANAPGSAPRYACRAWVNFNGTGTVAIRASGNVSSITDNGVGDYTVNFATAMTDTDYAAVPNAGSNGVTTGFAGPGGAAQTASAYRFRTYAAGAPPVLTDYERVTVAVFR